MTLTPLYLEQPLEIDEARRAAHNLAQQRRDAEDHHRQCVERAAEAEREYRRSLAEAFLTAEGATAAQREAVARALVADKSYDRDLAEGLVKASVERLRGLEGERSMLKSLIDWSARMNLDERARTAA